MRAKISYEDNRGRTKSTQIRPGQRLIIGSSFSADIVLADPAGVISEHAELFLRAEECSIRNLTGQAQSVLVNGDPIATANLSDGDAIEIGSNRLAVSFDRPTASANAAPAPSASSLSTESPPKSQPAREVAVPASEPTVDEPATGIERHKNIVILKIESFVKSIEPILRPDSGWSCFLVCNHNRSKSTAEPPASTNFLENAPAEIAGENDLFLVPIKDVSTLPELWDSYVTKDAGLLVLVSGEADEATVADGFRFLSAWFMIPSTLKFHLINGSPLLLDKVFGQFEYLVLSDSGTDQIIANDLDIDSLETFLKRIRETAQ